MQLFSRSPNFDFMGWRRPAIAISGIFILASAVSLATRGLNWGIDFTGGVLLEVAYDAPVELEDIRSVLAANGIDNAVVQNFGSATDVMIRLPPAEDVDDEASLGQEVLALLRAQDPTVERRGGAVVGSQVGEELAEQGGLAMLFAMLMIFMYVMLRFRWKFAAGAIAALVHDVIFVVGIFSMFGITADLTVLAAVLAVIGYSLNDTIVVFDRVRENFRAMRRGTPEEILNASINQTLARTFVTAITTLLVLFALLFLGGETVRAFALALIIGVTVGTYSTIYIATAAALMLGVSQADLLPPKREQIDDLP
jgi:preprotein translocase subunit SecF